MHSAAIFLTNNCIVNWVFQEWESSCNETDSMPKAARHEHCTPASRSGRRRCPCWGPCAVLTAGCHPRPRQQPASRPMRPSHRPRHRWRLCTLQQQTHSVCTYCRPSVSRLGVQCTPDQAGKQRTDVPGCNASMPTGRMCSIVRTKVTAAVVRAGIARVVSAGASRAGVCCACHGPRHPYPWLQEQLCQLLGLRKGNMSSVTAIVALTV